MIKTKIINRFKLKFSFCWSLCWYWVPCCHYALQTLPEGWNIHVKESRLFSLRICK